MKANCYQEGEFLTTAEVASLIRRSRHYVQSRWPRWSQWGVRPIRVGGKLFGGLLFRRADIERLIQSWQVAGRKPSEESDAILEHHTRSHPPSR